MSQRNFQALLLGLIKLRFYGEEDIKAQDVQNQIFEDSDLDPAGMYRASTQHGAFSCTYRRTLLVLGTLSHASMYMMIHLYVCRLFGLC